MIYIYIHTFALKWLFVEMMRMRLMKYSVCLWFVSQSHQCCGRRKRIRTTAAICGVSLKLTGAWWCTGDWRQACMSIHHTIQAEVEHARGGGYGNTGGLSDWTHGQVEGFGWNGQCLGPRSSVMRDGYCDGRVRQLIARCAYSRRRDTGRKNTRVDNVWLLWFYYSWRLVGYLGRTHRLMGFQ